jgi:hypothetical protein
MGYPVCRLAGAQLITSANRVVKNTSYDPNLDSKKALYKTMIFGFYRKLDNGYPVDRHIPPWREPTG